MSDLTSKTVDELRDDLIYGATCDGVVDEVAVSRFDEMVRRLEEAQMRSEALDAEIERMRPVVEAAINLRRTWLDPEPLFKFREQIMLKAEDIVYSAGEYEKSEPNLPTNPDKGT